MPMPYSASELRAIRAEYAKGSTDDQFENFIRECTTRNLIPGRHVYFQLRTQNAKDDNGNWVKEKRPIHLSSIDALRLIAQRTNQYEGQTPPIYIYLDGENHPSVKSDIMLPDLTNTDMPAIPYAVQVSVFRKGFQRALTATARFEAYAQKKYTGGLTDMWDRRGPEQLAKCAEALALRQAFPEEIGGLYLIEELRDEPEPEAETESKPKKKTKLVEAKNSPIETTTETEAAAATEPVVTVDDSEYRKTWAKQLRVLGVDNTKLKAYVEKKYGVKASAQLTLDQLKEIIANCTKAREEGVEELNKMLDG